MSYRKYLTASGVSDPRALDLAVNVGSLHRAICQLDARNLALIETLHPGILEIVDMYAQHEDAGLCRSFRKEISWKNI
jgi:hypothetical protein